MITSANFFYSFPMLQTSSGDINSEIEVIKQTILYFMLNTNFLVTPMYINLYNSFFFWNKTFIFIAIHTIIVENLNFYFHCNSHNYCWKSQLLFSLQFTQLLLKISTFIFIAIHTIIVENLFIGRNPTRS